MYAASKVSNGPSSFFSKFEKRGKFDLDSSFYENIFTSTNQLFKIFYSEFFVTVTSLYFIDAHETSVVEFIVGELCRLNLN